MRILVVSSGLKPEHFGGLPSHVEDLLHSLHRRGLAVGYLNTGAHSKSFFTHVVERSGLPCPAWNLSSKLAYARYWEGTLEPLSQVKATPAFSKCFWKVISAFKPEIVHFHELTSVPVEILDKLQNCGIRTVFSAADFYVLCPTVKLHRPDGSFCNRQAHELDCKNCSCLASPNWQTHFRHVNDATLAANIKLRNVGRQAIKLAGNLVQKVPYSKDYIKRRRRFEEILGRVDRVLATSHAQKRIFEERTTGWNIHLLQRSRSTIKATRPKARIKSRENGKLIFLALNIVNPAKGLKLLEDTFSTLNRELPNVELHLYGLNEGASPGIRYFGPYKDDDLDSIIDSADFGILPSLWPEAFGYVGPEMLSRGLPLIASNRGAMPDYVIDRQNGLLFDPSDPDHLISSIRELISSKPLREDLWRGAAQGERHYLTMEEHTDRLVNLYRDVIRDER